jgi:hypothetical protein
MLRLHTAEAYAQLLGGGDTAVATKTNQEVNISVEVFGFGPCFELIITVQSAMSAPSFNCYPLHLHLFSGNCFRTCC